MPIIRVLAKTSSSGLPTTENCKWGAKRKPQELKLPKKIVFFKITAFSSAVMKCNASPFISAKGKRIYKSRIATKEKSGGKELRLKNKNVSTKDLTKMAKSG